MKQGRLRVLMLLLADIACLYAVWAATVMGYLVIGLAKYEYGPQFYLRLWPLGICFVLLNALFRLYQGNALYPAAPVSPVEEMRRIFASSFLTHIGLIAFVAFARTTTEHYSRVVIAVSGVLVAVLTPIVRDLLRRAMMRFDCFRIPVALVGGGQLCERVRMVIDTDAHIGFRVTLVGDADAEGLLARARAANIRTLVSCQDLRLLRCRMHDFTEWFVHIVYLPTADALPVDGARSVNMDGIGGLEMVNQRHMGILRVEKRILDAGLSVFAFVFLSPLFLLIPVLVKLTSRGPVFYRQHRLGKMGRPFRIWKFRTMYADAESRLGKLLAENPAKAEEWRRNHKLRDDPRVTPLGRFLRRTSLDELPQLFNVFAGEMSLIGPRPIVKAEVAHYGSLYEVLSRVKPGVTGLWQSQGRSDTDYERRVALDMRYVLNWSIWLDLWILYRTFGTVVLMKGAR